MDALSDVLDGEGGEHPHGFRGGGEAGVGSCFGGVPLALGGVIFWAGSGLLGALVIRGEVGWAGGEVLFVLVGGEGLGVLVNGVGESLLAALRHLESELSHLSGDGGGQDSGCTLILVSVLSIADGVFSVMSTVWIWWEQWSFGPHVERNSSLSCPMH